MQKEYNPHKSTRYTNTDKTKSDKPLPELYENRENCCGCTACYSVCHVGAISMKTDEEGFLYPVIDAEKCIRCGKCQRVCSFKADQRRRGFLGNKPEQENISAPATYAVKHKEEGVRAASRSGGIFTALSDRVLSQNGVVYGCILTESFKAVHARAVTPEERNNMRGSKYIQSDLNGIFAQVKTDLEKGNGVLFSGTSCQIAGLKSYLEKEYDKLLCVDILCHGVPSPLVWEKYLKWQEQCNNSKVLAVDFRNKKDYGWKAHVESLYFENSNQVDSKICKKLFYDHYILRPSCYKCPYKSITHPGDITIADYWGIDKAAPRFNDNKGVSLVLVNNEKGKKIFDEVKAELNIAETKIEDSIQPPLKAPFPAPENRTQFWSMFYSKPFGKIVSRYGKDSFFTRVKNRIKRKLKK